LREPPGPEDTPEKLEAERQAAQDFIDNGALLGPYDSLPLKLMVPVQLNLSRRKNKRRRRLIWRMVSLIGVVVTSSS
jgi:hypothetical protein